MTFTDGSAADTAGIVHDINNQLTLIVNYLAIADVEGAQRATTRCTALTASLMSYCKGERIRIRPVRPDGFLTGYLSKLRLPETVRLELDCPVDLAPIWAEPAALERVLDNLVGNACAAMQNNGTVRITATSQTIEVEDSGPGIPAHLQKAVFDPFFSTKGAGGTGLGLSIVRNIMREHSGSVVVQSEPGQGTKFILRFRAA
jgi:signal transduction histidine kinase